MSVACIFCDIVAGKAEASPVFEDEHVMAFMDIRPMTPGHLLVIPRQHATDLSELPPELAGPLFGTAQKMAAALRKSALKPAGINLFLADGVAAGQEVFHVHLHVLPRNTGDGFGLRGSFSWPHRMSLDAHAAQIRSACEFL
ncbi:HIT family protein [Hoyosella rhizosphaerae]|uniref:HIT family protein n=1 Tax=Hoyosella rhizosphaerae TaxID=1755582 RepID=A0A916XHG0_9ACTN|nr:HIT family protein [Hoyosella rhizosphaerae]MBN4928278.1 HIT family protein [Hoyosella rhizosphaerae]GGC73751.1 HIT family protein [Hoyosella rhizosphaerae]